LALGCSGTGHVTFLVSGCERPLFVAPRSTHAPLLSKNPAPLPHIRFSVLSVFCSTHMLCSRAVSAGALEIAYLRCLRSVLTVPLPFTFSLRSLSFIRAILLHFCFPKCCLSACVFTHSGSCNLVHTVFTINQVN